MFWRENGLGNKHLTISTAFNHTFVLYFVEFCSLVFCYPECLQCLIWTPVAIISRKTSDDESERQMKL